jgi:hypothetical protein
MRDEREKENRKERKGRGWRKDPEKRMKAEG